MQYYYGNRCTGGYGVYVTSKLDVFFFILVSMLITTQYFICTCVYESFIHRQLIIYAQPTIEWCLQTDFAMYIILYNMGIILYDMSYL